MPTLDWTEASGLLRTMWRIRLFEERVGQLKRADEVHGLIHLSVGQEGVAAGVCSQLRSDDAVYSGHRAHGHAIAAGAPLERAMAELMGRADGLCKGLGGSMHLVAVEPGCWAPPAWSAATSRWRSAAPWPPAAGGDQVAVVFFGDGAGQAGIFNESINLAALWELPVIFVCENNGFAEFTPRSAHTKVERVTDVVAPYGLTRDTIDGNDVVAVWETFAGFLAAARAGRGPLLLECLTHRLRGHYEGDPAHYRKALAAEDWQEKDPILRLQRHGIAEGWFVDEDAAEIERDAQQAVDAAVEFARASPFPPGRARRRAHLRVVKTTYVKAIVAAQAQAMREDPRVFVLGEDVAEGGPYGTTAGLAEEFGTDRVLNTPISESAICGVAIGAAQSGMRPIVEVMFIDFVTLALDQLVNQAAKAHAMSGGQLSVPLVLRTQGGAGRRWGAQHSQSLESWLTHIPGLKVLMPSRAADAAGLLASAIADPNPVVFVENKTLYFKSEDVPKRPPPVAIGEALVVRPGRDVTVVALSRLVDEALDAAERLAADGVEAEVIDPRTLVPLDLETILDSVRRTNRLVIAHEAVEHGGFGAEIAAQVQAAAFDHLDAPIERVGAPFTPVPFSPPLEDAYVPGADEVYAAAKRLLA